MKISLAFILAFATFLGLKLAFGFNLVLYLPLAAASFIAAIAWPGPALGAVLCLTIVFANQYSLAGIEVGDAIYKFYLPDILLTGAFIGVAARFIKGQITCRWRWPEWLMLAFFSLTFLYFILSIVLLDGQFALAFSSFKNYAFYPLIYFAIYATYTTKGQLKQLAYLAFGAVITTVYFVGYGVLAGKGLWTEITPLTTSGNRLLDFDHAFYLCLATIAGLSYLLFGKQKIWRRVWLWLLPVFFFGIIGSLMRHLWIAGLATVGFLFSLPYVRRQAMAKKVLADYFVSGAAVFLLMIMLVNVLPDFSLSRKIFALNDQTMERLFSISNEGDTSFTWRAGVWESAWQQFRGRELLGIGFGQSVFVKMPDYLDRVEVRNVHNSFLAILIQMGFPAIALLVFFVAKLFWGLWQKAGQWPLVNIALTGMIFFCGIAFLFQPYLEANFFNIIFWSLLGISRRSYEGLNG